MSRPGEVWLALHASELQCTENCTCLSSHVNIGSQ